MLRQLAGLAAIAVAWAEPALAVNEKLPWGQSSDMAAWQTFVQAVAIGLFVLPVSGPFLIAASVVMAAAIVLTVITGLDYVASTVREVRRSAS